VSTDGSIPLLDLAEQNGVDIEYSCRSGSCGTCRTRCSPVGKVDMGTEYSLDPDDERQGYVLACCAKPRANLQVEA
jgi:ferredoxin